MLETAEAPKQAFNSDEENPAFVWSELRLIYICSFCNKYLRILNLDENSEKSDNQEIASGLK